MFNRKKEGGIGIITTAISKFNEMRVELQRGIQAGNEEISLSQSAVVNLQDQIKSEEQKQSDITSAIEKANKVIANISTFLAE